MDGSGFADSDREAIVRRLVKVQNESLPFLARELTRYHARTNGHSYFSKLPEEQKLAWVQYGLDYISSIYLSGRSREGVSWEKNLALSSLGGGFRGVNESICGMMVMSHLLVPIVRSEFADSPVVQSLALELLSDAYRTLIDKSLLLYDDYVRGAREDMLASSARTLEDISVDGLLVETEVPQSIAAYRLTRRELEVLRLVGLGYENGEICSKLNTKLDTVKGQVRSLLSKTNLHNRTQLALLAVSAGVCKKEEIIAALGESQG